MKNPKTNLIMIINHPFVIFVEFREVFNNFDHNILIYILSQFINNSSNIIQVIILLVVYPITGLHPTLKTENNFCL